MNWIQISSGLLTPVIAVIAVYIAYRQHKTASDKLRLELYDRRYRIYQLTKEYVLKCYQSDDDLDVLGKFYPVINEGKFLFKKDFTDYLTSVVNNSLHQQQIKKDLFDEKTYPLNSPAREKLLQKQRELYQWFGIHFGDIENKFLPYLNFQNVEGDFKSDILGLFNWRKSNS